MQSPSLAQQHHTFAAEFIRVAGGVSDLTAATPVPEWDVRGLLEHMIWFHDFVHGGSPFGWTRRVDPAVDPVGAFVEQTAAVQNILDDPAQAESPFFHPMASGQSLGEATARFYVSDVVMHTWDLARATAQEVTFDEPYVAGLSAGMQAQEATLRASGQFGAAQPVSDDADPLTRLMAFLGRDPHFGR
ncbi:TIGR03086 family metal-binding protein [Nocardioides yefusunii]|uniref:TIGR03086 family metal-binding protein n=1 Tax=Nocardioides yefusunii TaxID=2500546 RepID=A0ABW1R114_9ACTN|nr:TIGR03086 family metal-binding protein [Nocardioides yefusunii]